MARLVIDGHITSDELDPILTIQLYSQERNILLQEHSIVHFARRNRNSYRVIFAEIPQNKIYIVRYILKDRSTGEIIQRFTRAARTT